MFHVKEGDLISQSVIMNRLSGVTTLTKPVVRVNGESGDCGTAYIKTCIFRRVKLTKGNDAAISAPLIDSSTLQITGRVS